MNPKSFTDLYKRLVYKCPYVGCDKKYKIFDLLQEHLDKIIHKTEEMMYKCVIDTCKEPVECKEHYDKKNSRLLIYTKYQENVIDHLKSDFCRLNIDDLMNERGIIVKILKTFIINGGINCHDEDGLTHCRVPSCNKKYKSVPGYFYHILFYKHSLAELVAEYVRTSGTELDEHKLKAELSDDKFSKGFRIMGIRQRTHNIKKFYKAISFKNDFNQIDIKKDKFMPKRALVACDPSFIKSYEQELGETSLIHNLIYKGETFDGTSGSLTFGISFLNLKEFVTAVFYDEMNKNIIVVCRSSKEPDILYDFNSHPSNILVLDMNLNILDTFNFPFGFCRKFRMACPHTYYTLFKDGRIRKIDFKQPDNSIEIIGDGYIDFELIDNDVLICTDGLKLYKIKENTIVAQSGFLPSAIVSLVVKRPQQNNEEKTSFLSNRKSKIKEVKAATTLKDSLYFVNDDDNSLLDEMRVKLDTFKIVCSTVEGIIYAFNDDLSDFLDVIGTLTLKIDYLEAIDLFVFTDSVSEKTKVLSIEKEFITTHVILDKMTNCHTTIKGAIVSGGFDGSVYRTWYNYYKLKNQKLVTFYRSGHNLLILDNENEYNVLKNRKEYDYSTLIVHTFESELFLYIFLSSGVVLKMLLRG